MQEAKRLDLWVERHLLSIVAEYISRATNVHTKWHLHPPLFWKLMDRFGLPVVDLFTTLANVQLLRFYTRFPARAEGVDALRSPWLPGVLYAFPLLPLIPKVIQTILAERAEILLLIPHWPR